MCDLLACCGKGREKQRFEWLVEQPTENQMKIEALRKEIRMRDLAIPERTPEAQRRYDAVMDLERVKAASGGGGGGGCGGSVYRRGDVGGAGAVGDDEVRRLEDVQMQKAIHASLEVSAGGNDALPAQQMEGPPQEQPSWPDDAKGQRLGGEGRGAEQAGEGHGHDAAVKAAAKAAEQRVDAAAKKGKKKKR